MRDVAAALHRIAAGAGEVAAGIQALAEAIQHAPATSTDDLVDAHTCGLGPKLYRRLARSGELAAFRVGRRYVSRRADVDAWLASQRVAPTGTPVVPSPTSAKPVAQLSESSEALADQLVAQDLAAGRLHVIRGGK